MKRRQRTAEQLRRDRHAREQLVARCLCCGRSSGERFCKHCRAHVLDGPQGDPKSRTFEALTGKPCPFREIYQW